MGRTLESFLAECLMRGVTDMAAHVEEISDEIVLTLNPANVVDHPQSFIVRDNRAIPNLCSCLEPEKL